ncbi:alcohol dehydrogenase catalytic domain-containing protein [Corynebacterium diphtheriae]|uniref:alcohol dehydrogenase catalytic domain-containing protein n=1 Tax=Corynebacterium diphtheriae TaxID=1717 RepID=UPI0018CBD8C5|nr:alcohol dehydrogenase catalytic domain-containing protein [Corynebacterium diphtheriae]MBG9294957.1 alcohol dehydrogenase catalytic domain-containing protein [Corynebacterium diphtheriae bv. mitis]MBG9317984.1 alcohol dehydrogenase catalytic domain-containing protein [Corynebacterium diphtheriae bv. mitis]
MRAAVISGKGLLATADLPTPVVGPDEVLIRVAYVGICGSDLHYYQDGAVGAFEVREPLVPGHEMSGTLADGTAVTVHSATFGQCCAGLEEHPHLWPGGAYLGSASTSPHTQGAMQEFLLVRKDQVRVLPDGVPLRRAALAEPLSVGLHAINVAGGVAGKNVLVSGAGPIGQLAALAALREGAASVTLSDVVDGPLERAHAGLTRVNTRAVRLGDESFDVVLECAGVAVATSDALRVVRRRGVVVQVGMLPNVEVGVNVAPLVAKEVQLRGTFRFRDEVDRAVEMLRDPIFDTVITHEFAVDDVVEAFDTAADSQVSGKVVVAL